MVTKMLKMLEDFIGERLLPDLAASVAQHRAGEKEKLDLAREMVDDLPEIMFESLTEKSEEYRRLREIFDSQYHQVYIICQSLSYFASHAGNA